MTDPQGFTEVFGRFSAETDSAVARARRVAAQAREAGERFRKRTAELSASSPAGVRATPEALRRAATGFRVDHGLPVREQPAPAVPGPPDAPASDPVPPDAGVLSSRWEPARPRRIAPPDDDDEDFSQQRILY